MRRAIGALAWSHSITYLLGATVLTVLARRRLRPRPPVLGRILATGIVAAVGCGLTMAAVAGVLPFAGRTGDLVEVVFAGAVGLAVYVVLQQVLGGTRVASVVELVRPGATRG